MIVQSVSLYDQAPGTSMPYARTLMLVGQTGQGVTLMSDLLAEAVQLSGWKTRTQERFAACKKAGEVCSLLQLSSSGQFSAVAELSCDLILSWSAPSLVAQLQHLHPTGRALAWDAETRLATDSRLIFLSPTDCPPLLAACKLSNGVAALLPNWEMLVNWPPSLPEQAKHSLLLHQNNLRCRLSTIQVDNLSLHGHVDSSLQTKCFVALQIITQYFVQTNFSGAHCACHGSVSRED